MNNKLTTKIRSIKIMSQQDEKEQLESRSTESEENSGQIPGSDQKIQQTKEVKLQARQAAKEAKQKEQEDKQRENQLAEEAKLQAKETNKTDVTPDKLASLENIISRDNNEIISGSVTLEFDPGIHHTKVSQITNSLSKNSNVQVISVGGYAGKGSWVRLFVNNAIPIYQVLYSTSIVQQVSRRGNNIHIVFQVSE